MKKLVPVVGMMAMILALGARTAHAQTVGLDAAVQGIAAEFSPNIERGASVAVIAIQADSVGMSNHLINGMVAALFGMRSRYGFEVASRGQIEMLMAEQELSMSGLVDDASAVSIGRLAGVQYILTGTFMPFGNAYRFWAQLIEVETGFFRGISTVDVPNDAIVSSLLGAAGRTDPGPPILPLPPQQRARRDLNQPRVNWLSAWVNTTTWGGGMRYERSINELFSIGAHGFFNFQDLVGGRWINSLDIGISVTARLFPGGFPFYLELGMGVGSFALEDREDRQRYNRYNGLMIDPAFGIILGGRTTSFFINPFLSLPTIFVNERTDARFTFGIGIGGAW